jgi:hypothetical protein
VISFIAFGCGQKEIPGKLRINGWFLLHKNAPAHQTVLVKDFIALTSLTRLQFMFTCSTD